MEEDDERRQGPGADGSKESQAGIPRDLPDEQAGNGSDHWDADLSRAADDTRGGTPAGEPAPVDDPEGGQPAEEPAPDEPTG
ncbi:hypothetical protein AB0A69_27035 [Streptomyces sp. NPDC045431]|uniref:hypothetical protein n=1 Tax=Streptomyces sp. NPDC045431 TaxID=3155613 RepID=UPI0033F1CFA5